MSTDRRRMEEAAVAAYLNGTSFSPSNVESAHGVRPRSSTFSRGGGERLSAQEPRAPAQETRAPVREQRATFASTGGAADATDKNTLLDNFCRDNDISNADLSAYMSYKNGGSSGGNVTEHAGRDLLTRFLLFAWNMHPLVTFVLLLIALGFVAFFVLYCYTFVGDEFLVCSVLFCMAFFFLLCNLNHPGNMMLVFLIFLVGVGCIPHHRKFVQDNHGNCPYLTEFDKRLETDGYSLFEVLWIPVQFRESCFDSMHTEACADQIQFLYNLGAVNRKIVDAISPSYSSEMNVLVSNDDVMSNSVRTLYKNGFDRSDFLNDTEFLAYQGMSGALRLLASHQKRFKEFSDHESYGGFVNGVSNVVSMTNYGLGLCHVVVKSVSKIAVHMKPLKHGIVLTQASLSFFGIASHSVIKQAQIMKDWSVNICTVSHCIFKRRVYNSDAKKALTAPVMGAKHDFSGNMGFFEKMFYGESRDRDSVSAVASLPHVPLSLNNTSVVPVEWASTIDTFAKRHYTPQYLNMTFSFMESIGANLSSMQQVFEFAENRKSMSRQHPFRDAVLIVLFPEIWTFFSQCQDNMLKIKNDCKYVKPDWTIDSTSFGSGAITGTFFASMGSSVLRVASSGIFALGNFAFSQLRGAALSPAIAAAELSTVVVPAVSSLDTLTAVASGTVVAGVREAGAHIAGVAVDSIASAAGMDHDAGFDGLGVADRFAEYLQGDTLSTPDSSATWFSFSPSG